MSACDKLALGAAGTGTAAAAGGAAFPPLGGGATGAAAAAAAAGADNGDFSESAKFASKRLEIDSINSDRLIIRIGVDLVLETAERASRKMRVGSRVPPGRSAEVESRKTIWHFTTV
jgi:hypothetical protein